MDIEFYLDKEEVTGLGNGKRIEGCIVRINKPKQQGIGYISVNDSRKNENGYGIGVKDDWNWNSKTGTIELFLSDEYYKIIVKNGVIGTRYGHLGSKVSVYDKSAFDDERRKLGIPSLSSTNKDILELLEHYRDNKDKLHPGLG